MLKKIMEIKEMLCEEMIKESEHGIHPGNLEAIYMMAVAAEKIMKMGVLEGEMDGGYSQGRGYSVEGGYSGNRYPRDGGSYDGGESYARRREHWVKGHYSYDDEMAGAREYVVRMMEEARNPQEKEAFRRCLEAFDKK